ncbi:MAG: hypothetical protein LLF94_03580 [Chlamydiales bacterium]|nr:hypothetical protein [Chlamydiales bacterium]
MFNNSRKSDANSLQNIPIKANIVLNVIFCILLLVALRLWHLSVIQHDKKVEEAFLARKRTLIEPAARGTIRDRFNILLAANKIEYRVSIVYSQFRDIPAVIAQYDEAGNKKRRYLRREYIHKLSEKVANIIGVDAERLEDIIYSHAAQNNNIPFVIKKGLSEEEYYQLQLLEKDWQGIHVQCVPKRYYPAGRTACDVIGYMGPISKEKYTNIVAEIRTLSDYILRKEQGQEVDLPQSVTSFAEANQRLLKLTEQAYTINDSVGLLGIEASFENDLRGLVGKKSYFSDAKGNSLRKLPGTIAPTVGKRVLLSLSVELQEYAEKLLAQAETDREYAFTHDPKAKKAKEPLIRGGAIVALDPKTGQVVALASFPRYDPNDFIRSKNTFFSEDAQDHILRWLENETYIGRIWDQFVPFSCQRYSDKTKEFIDVDEYLTWDRFLEFVLPENSNIFDTLHSSEPIKKVIQLQQTGSETDFLVTDLSRLILSAEDFSGELIAEVGDLSIDEYRDLSSSYTQLTEEMRKDVRPRWKEAFFKTWRKENEKAFLKQKRLDEKKAHTYQKPYLDYIDKEEARQFDEFWQQKRFELTQAFLETNNLPTHYVALASQLEGMPKDLQTAFLASLKGFKDLGAPLYGTYPRLVPGKTDCTLQDLVMCVRKGLGEGSLRSYAYRHAAIQGSLFKLVTAYAALKQRYIELKGKVTAKDLTLFDIVDKTYKYNGKNYVGAFASGAPIPQMYKGGRIPKSMHHDLGKLNLVSAIEVSSNPYFSLIAGDYLHDPKQLSDAAMDFGFGQKTGISLPGEMQGSIPQDLATNRTGLYSMAIGQHSLLTTPLQSACMLSAIANGGTVVSPRIVDLVVGKGQYFEQTTRAKKANFAYKDVLGLVGIDFPLFSKADKRQIKNEVVVPPVKEAKSVYLPKEIQKTLLDGLKKVIGHIHEDRSGALKRLSTSRPDQYKAFYELKDSLIGKTSTAESQEKIGIDIGQPSIIYNHTWFGGISYAHGEPDLVVIVYQRYGGYGRETAPLAAQVIKKWRQIQTRT